MVVKVLSGAPLVPSYALTVCWVASATKTLLPDIVKESIKVNPVMKLGLMRVPEVLYSGTVELPYKPMYRRDFFFGCRSPVASAHGSRLQQVARPINRLIQLLPNRR
jgi:hypothetical protein